MNQGIKFWAHDDRPREKMLLKGKEALSDAELIAILIASGNKELSAVDLAKQILLAADNNLNELAKFTINDLQKHKGIGEAKAITIVAALELQRRRKASEILKKSSIKSSSDAYELFNSMLGDKTHEEFWALYLNNSNKIVHKQQISIGSDTATTVSVKIIMKFALEKFASALIVCHNHPSGNINPSKQDNVITQKIKDAGKLLDIQLLDHIIVTQNEYYSYADSGLI